MMFENLSETLAVKTISDNGREGSFEIEGLYAGYGTTVGNALRRVLLSSLPGAAITQVKVRGVSHEFTAIPGVLEDMVEIILNLKTIRFRIHTDEPQTLTVKAKGEGAVTAAQIETNSSVELMTPEALIATITDKSTELSLELTVERGLGYVAVEARRADKLPIGVVALDAAFSPVIKVNFSVENMRVGDRTDYHKVNLVVETDGSIAPSQAVHGAAKILADHFTKIMALEVVAPTSAAPSGEAEGEAKKKRAAKAKQKKEK
jgi:DNA-directed RNA polymerase subunit alpha